MHTFTLVKYAAESAAEALSEVEELMNETTGDGKRFDYMGQSSIITEKDFSEFSVSSYEELEERYKGFTADAEKGYKESIQRNVLEYLSMRIMPLEEAPLFTNKGSMCKASSTEVLRSGIGKDIPKTLTELAELVSASVIQACDESSFAYSVKYLEILLESKDYSDFSDQAECGDIHFLDHTKMVEDDEDTEKQIFYVLIDRHY